MGNFRGRQAADPALVTLAAAGCARVAAQELHILPVHHAITTGPSGFGGREPARSAGEAEPARWSSPHARRLRRSPRTRWPAGSRRPLFVARRRLVARSTSRWPWRRAGRANPISERRGYRGGEAPPFRASHGIPQQPRQPRARVSSGLASRSALPRKGPATGTLARRRAGACKTAGILAGRQVDGQIGEPSLLSGAVYDTKAQEIGKHGHVDSICQTVRAVQGG